MKHSTCTPIVSLLLTIVLIVLANADDNEQNEKNVIQDQPQAPIVKPKLDSSNRNPEYELSGWNRVTRHWPNYESGFMIADTVGHHYISTSYPDGLVDKHEVLEYKVEYYFDYSELAPDIIAVICKDSIPVVDEKLMNGRYNSKGEWQTFSHLIEQSKCDRKEIQLHVLLHDKGDTFAWRLVSLKSRVNTPSNPEENVETVVPEKDTDSGKNVENTDTNSGKKVEEVVPRETEASVENDQKQKDKDSEPRPTDSSDPQPPKDSGERETEEDKTQIDAPVEATKPEKTEKEGTKPVEGPQGSHESLDNNSKINEEQEDPQKDPVEPQKEHIETKKDHNEAQKDPTEPQQDHAKKTGFSDDQIAKQSSNEEESKAPNHSPLQKIINESQVQMPGLHSLMKRFSRSVTPYSVQCTPEDCDRGVFQFNRFTLARKSLPDPPILPDTPNEDYYLSYTVDTQSVTPVPMKQRSLTLSLKSTPSDLSEYDVCFTWKMCMDPKAKLDIYYNTVLDISKSQLITSFEGAGKEPKWERYKVCTSDFVFKLRPDADSYQFYFRPSWGSEAIAIQFAERAVNFNELRQSQPFVPNFNNIETIESFIDTYWHVHQANGHTPKLEFVDTKSTDTNAVEKHRKLKISSIDPKGGPLLLTSRWIKLNNAPGKDNKYLPLNYVVSNQDWIDSIDLHFERYDAGSTIDTVQTAWKRETNTANSLIELPMQLSGVDTRDFRVMIKHSISDDYQQQDGNDFELDIMTLALADLCAVKSYCNNRGQCKPTDAGAAECKCLQGYEGDQCEIIKPCDVLYYGKKTGNEICQSIGSVCMTDMKFLRCQCPKGQYFEFGSLEQASCKPIDNCVAVKCDYAAGKVCKDGNCVCDSSRGFQEGAGGKCNLANPCSRSNICGSAKCVPIPATGKYECLCPLGYSKINKDEEDTSKTECIIQEQVCKNPLLNKCEHKCDINNNEIECSCLQGYKLASDSATCYPEFAESECEGRCSPNEICVKDTATGDDNTTSNSYGCICERQGYYNIQNPLQTQDDKPNSCMNVCDAAEYDQNIANLVAVTCKIGKCAMTSQKHSYSLKKGNTKQDIDYYTRKIQCNCDDAKGKLKLDEKDPRQCQYNFDTLSQVCMPGNEGYNQCVKNSHAFCMVDLSNSLTESNPGYKCVCGPGRQWVKVNSTFSICASACQEQDIECRHSNKYCVDGLLEPTIEIDELITKSDNKYVMKSSESGCQCLPGFAEQPSLGSSDSLLVTKCLKRKNVIHHLADLKLYDMARLGSDRLEELRRRRRILPLDTTLYHSCDALLSHGSFDDTDFAKCERLSRDGLSRVKNTYTDYDGLVAAKFRDSADTLGPAQLSVDRVVCSQPSHPTDLVCRVTYSADNDLNLAKTFDELRYKYDDSHDLLAPSLLVSKVTFQEYDQRFKVFNPCEEDIDYCDYRSDCKHIDGENFECVCKPGYREVYGRSDSNEARQTISSSSKYGRAICEDINECLNDPCVHVENSTGCVNTEGSYMCPCKESHTGDDRTHCVHVCDAISCDADNGKCVIVGPHRAYCECNEGRSGIDCKSVAGGYGQRKLIIILAVVAASLIIFGIVIIANLTMRVLSFRKRLNDMALANKELVRQRVGPVSSTRGRVGVSSLAITNQSFEEW